ncbi:RIP metalloprotease RseP [uncultured Castellaniella sp.]|uniref:RIP metalloprotease RseP n=1 Tax=uncultured Castellaniella sp. TaxID=647907 RepID=UPI00263264FB|nr:RIP metalloprotease RseP [uncultured Castellaniella sp.]
MLFTLFAFILALGLLVTFHELGHYWVARRCGVRILRFSVGFGPVLLRRHDRRGTEWAVSAIPLGGYVKMLDDAPPGADAATRRAAFNAQPLSRRVAVVAAGPLANLLLAAVIYTLLGLWGTQEPAAILAAPAAGTPAAQAGLQAGDRLTAVDGRAVASWTQARWQLLEPLAGGGQVTLSAQTPQHAVRQATLQLSSHDFGPDGPDPLAQAGLALQAPRAVIGTVNADGVARQAGLQAGDVVLAAGGQEGPSVQAFVRIVQEHPGQPLALRVQRQSAALDLTLTPAAVDDAGRTVGRIGALIEARQPLVLVRLGPLESLWSGARRTWDTSLFTVRMMGRMVAGAVSWRNISGPVTIAEYAGQTARLGLEAYLSFLALISISIGVLNLLPIPMLDGGHLLFYLIEALRGGRPVSDRVRDLGSRVGMGLVFSLMFLALFNDFSRLFR